MKAVLIGSGNVATHLSAALTAAGHSVLQVFSKSLINARELAAHIEAEATDNLAELNAYADVYIISVPDAAIAEVASKFPFRNKLVVHTSGTTELDVLKAASERTGVFYPLQTFSKARQVEFSTVPLAVEAKHPDDEDLLLQLASSLSGTVLRFDSAKRRAIHLAAVFACNFSNHFYTIAGRLLDQNGLNFDLLRPLIAETSLKVQQFSPFEVQTGPAVRNDQVTINEHLKLLEATPELRELYSLISQNIINLHQKA